MSCGLVALDAGEVPLKDLSCSGEVTESFGLFTLTQRYYNETDTTLRVRYIFPIPQGGAVTDFYALVNGKKISSELTDKSSASKLTSKNNGSGMLSMHSDGTLEAYLGAVNPKCEICVTIKYLCSICSESNAVRLIIPTVIAPRYVAYGKQIALENVVAKTSYTIKLDMIYRGKDILSINSPTHKIFTEMDSYGARICFAGEESANRDIIIDITLKGKNRPIMYYYKDIAYYSFTPKIDIYKRTGREYCFILDTSDSMEGEKIRQAKNALLIALGCLQKGDSFNIIAFNSTYNRFSQTAVEFEDKTLSEARKWLQSQKVCGGTELMRPVILASEGKNVTALIFTDGQIANAEDILNYVSSHPGTLFYTFGIDTAQNTEFLTRLAAISGAAARFIEPKERIDEALISSFNKIAAPTIKNASVSFDVPASEITPRNIKQIHAGEKVIVAAKFSGTPPKRLTVSGQLKNHKCIMEVMFEHPLKAGKELFYYLAKQQIDYLRLIHTANDIQSDIIKKRICSLSLKAGILSEETAFVLFFGSRETKKIIDVVIPSMMPSGWTPPMLSMREKPKKRGKMDNYLKILKGQRANGSFVRANEKTPIATANILHYFCTECDKADLFVWQLRKAAEYLLLSIQKSNDAQIPGCIIDALEAWHKKFGVNNDEISQKIDVLIYMYRKY